VHAPIEVARPENSCPPHLPHRAFRATLDREAGVMPELDDERPHLLDGFVRIGQYGDGIG